MSTCAVDMTHESNIVWNKKTNSTNEN